MLEARQICVTAGRATLLDQVSLTVTPGELLAVLGPNGAGKSTLLKVLAGDVRPTSGQVTLNQKKLRDWPLQALGRMRAVLPQHARIAFSLTAMGVALYGRFPHCGGRFSARDRAIACAMLAKMHVLHLADRDFRSLSGGEQNRVQLARVLAQIDGKDHGKDGNTDDKADNEPPRYLLLDEPTAALDLPHQHHLLQQARQLAESGKVGVLIVLHDVNLAAQYAHRIVYMKKGRKLDEGPIAAMMDAGKIAACFDIETVIIPHPIDRRPMMIV